MKALLENDQEEDTKSIAAHDKKYGKNDDEEFRAIIQYILMDRNYVEKHDNVEKVIGKLIDALGTLAWLHNCTKMQVQPGILPNDILVKEGRFWLVTRYKNLYYNKNKEQDLMSLPRETRDLI